MQGRPVLMFGSNDYLSLANHPVVKQAAIDAASRYGTSPSGARMLNGTRDLHNQLEAELAQFVGKSDHFTCAVGDIYGDGRMHFVTGSFSLSEERKMKQAITIWENSDRARSLPSEK